MSRAAFTTYAPEARKQQIEADARALAIEYGKSLTAARERRGARLRRPFTAEDLARRAGLPSWFVEDLERGTTKRTPTLEIMYRLARALRVHPAELLPIAGVVQ